MKVSSARLYRLAGLAAVLAGVCYVTVGVFHPVNALASVTTTRWGIVHVLACAVCFFGLLGLTGIYVRQAAKAGWVGLVGFVLLNLWMVLIMGFSFVEVLILPHLAIVAPGFVDGWMGMFNGDPSTVDLGFLPTLWTITAPLYIGGGVLFGLATFRARVFPRGAAILLALGTVLGARGSPASSGRAAEDRDTHRCGPRLAGICADDQEGRASGRTRAPARGRGGMTSPSASAHRGVARTAGILYVLTFVSIPTLALYRPVKSGNYLIGTGSDTSAMVGALLEVTVALAGIATAVVLFPILKKQNESMALGLVAARILESATIFVGVAFLLTIVTLHHAGAGAPALLTSQTLVALYDRIFLLGQSFMPAVCDVLLGLLLYQSRLVPRGLAVIGIAGGPILVVGYLAMIFGAAGPHGAVAGLTALPVAVFEFSFGVWLIVKGFNPQAAAALDTRNAPIVNGSDPLPALSASR